MAVNPRKSASILFPGWFLMRVTVVYVPIVGNISRGIVLTRLAEAGAVVEVSSRVDLGGLKWIHGLMETMTVWQLTSGIGYCAAVDTCSSLLNSYVQQ